LTGTVDVSIKGKKIEHQGILCELIGMIDLIGEK